MNNNTLLFQKQYKSIVLHMNATPGHHYEDDMSVSSLCVLYELHYPLPLYP